MKKAIIYGAGRTGKVIYEKAVEANIEIVTFIDNTVSGELFGIPVTSVSDITTDLSRDIPVILALHHEVHTAAESMSAKGFKNLVTISGFNITLCRSGCIPIDLVPVCDPALLKDDTDKINAAKSLFADKRSLKIFQHYIEYLQYGRLDDLERRDPGVMYYPENRPFQLTGEITMADCGAFTGDAIIPLIPLINFKRIYAFDPDPMVAEELEQNLSRFNNLSFKIIKAGVGIRDEKLFFQPDGSGRGTVIENGGFEIDVVTLDNVFKDNKVDFIKMDIEGAEIQALKGAEKIIKRDMPLLEICVYHRWGDFWNIPLLIHQINPQYSIYLRCNDDSFHDTVCCAVPERYKNF